MCSCRFLKRRGYQMVLSILSMLLVRMQVKLFLATAISEASNSQEVPACSRICGRPLAQTFISINPIRALLAKQAERTLSLLTKAQMQKKCLPPSRAVHLNSRDRNVRQHHVATSLQTCGTM